MRLRRFVLPTVLLLATAGCAGAQQYQYNVAPQGYPGAPQGYPVDQQGYPVAQQELAITSVDQFYAPLGQFGRWTNTQWGRGWVPSVGRDWRPYTVGQWIDDPQYGWTWASDEPWGWATYHYGRWGFDQRLGWVWVPGLEWAPAWVAWRDGNDVTGWAPLPPQVSYSYSFGVGAVFDSWGYDQWYAPAWVYAPRTSFYYPYRQRQTYNWQQGRTWWNQTRGVTHYDRDDDRVVNRSMANVRPRPGSPGYGSYGQWSGDRNHAENGRPQSYGQQGGSNGWPAPPVRPGHPDTAGSAGQGGYNPGQWNGQQRPDGTGRPPQYGQPGGSNYSQHYNNGNSRPSQTGAQDRPQDGQQRPDGTGRPPQYGQQGQAPRPGDAQPPQYGGHGGRGGQPAQYGQQGQAPRPDGDTRPPQYAQHGDHGGPPPVMPPVAVPATPVGNPVGGYNGGYGGGRGGHGGGAPVTVAPPVQSDGGGHGMRPVAPVMVAPVPASAPPANVRPVAPKPAPQLDEPKIKTQ